MVAWLLYRPGWLEGLDPELRKTIHKKLEQGVRDAKNGRQLATMMKCLALMDRLDLERARLGIDFAKVGATADDELARQKRMREALEQADDSMVGDPNATPRPPGDAIE
jgi:hypothetical protein